MGCLFNDLVLRTKIALIRCGDRGGAAGAAGDAVPQLFA